MASHTVYVRWSTVARGLGLEDPPFCQILFIKIKVNISSHDYHSNDHILHADGEAVRVNAVRALYAVTAPPGGPGAQAHHRTRALHGERVLVNLLLSGQREQRLRRSARLVYTGLSKSSEQYIQRHQGQQGRGRREAALKRMGQLQFSGMSNAAYDLDNRGSYQRDDLCPEAGTAPGVRPGHDAQDERFDETAASQTYDSCI